MSSNWYYNNLILEKYPGDAPMCQAGTFSFLGHGKVQKLQASKAAEDSDYLLRDWKIFHYFTDTQGLNTCILAVDTFISEGATGGSLRDDRHRHHHGGYLRWRL